MTEEQRRVCATILFWLSLCAFTPLLQLRAEVISPSPAIRALSEDSGGALLDFRLPAFDLQEASGSSRVILPGWARTSSPGSPDFPITGVLIAIPKGVAATAIVLAADARSIPVERIALAAFSVPAPDSRDQDFRDTGRLLRPPVASLARSNDSDGPRVTLEPPIVIRGNRFVRLVVSPFAWDERNQVIRYWDTARIQILFSQEPAAAPRPRPLAPQAAGGSDSGRYPDGARVRIEVTEDGFCEITSSELLRLGFDLSSGPPRDLQLWNRGQQVAFTLVHPSGSRRGNMTLRFFATHTDSRYTATNVYWLCRAPGGGKRITTRNADPGAVTTQTWFDEVITQEENIWLWDATPGAPEADYWLWEKLTAPTSRTYTAQLPQAAATQTQGLLKIWFQGRSIDAKDPNHHIRILWDNVQVGEVSWAGMVTYDAQVTLSAGQLTEGAHSLKFDLPGDTGAALDIVYLNRFQVSYRRRLEPTADLQFGVSATNPRAMELKYSGAAPVEIFDITDVRNPVELTNFATTTSLVRFRHPGAAAHRYYFVPATSVKKPASIGLWQPEGLRSSSNRADHLIIAPQEFVSALAPLRAYRQSEGLVSRIVTTEEIFNEFNDGLAEPDGIKSFLSYAYFNWAAPKPRYVLLVGDGTVDYLNYLGNAKRGKVPVHVTWTSQLGVTPDDHWYGCVDGDDAVADLMVGRIPGATASQVSATVSKILAFEQSGGKAVSRVLAAADDGETQWETTSNQMLAQVPAYYTADKVYLRTMTTAGAKAAILADLNKGPAVASYVGHGAIFNWTGEFIFQASDVPKLTNGTQNLSFVVSLNCLNAYFCHPSEYCLAEELVNAPNKGAFACFAPSALSMPWEHEILGVELYSALLQERQRTIGNAIAEAEVRAYAQLVFDETLEMFTLIGDPASKIKEW
jgi:hypothetical protein